MRNNIFALQCSLILFLQLVQVIALQAQNIVYPDNCGTIDIKAQYGAVGNGITDDTKAIQKAIDDNKFVHQVIYFPNGTYLVSKTLDWGGAGFPPGAKLSGPAPRQRYH
ncbi:MAG: hypothetical protein HC896_01305 [Bacteroidales bacterium]|nr:hypothetical protein [Bacteroidales bacterium]